MGEIKSVKVDNWGVFFLQKLQNFFNKTDYCDLTLQFRDNSQLKVHRLVLSACTDYFNVLEQTCDVVDDALIMPNELQADVVVPIVNFMYTGTLEFELKMYGKLLRTAKEMNMTVLLKLLEAHRRTMEGVNRSQRPPSPKTMRRRTTPICNINPTQPQVPQQRRVLSSANLTQQRRIVQAKMGTTNTIPQAQIRQQGGTVSMFKSSGVGGVVSNKGQFTGSSYESLQFKREAEDYEGKEQQSTSPFEQLRKGYNNNKRPSTASFISPPAKKPNIEDVKEFAEQQRMRKQIAAEYGEDAEYEGMMDDVDIHNYDDDDDVPASNAGASSAGTSASNQQQEIQGSGATITFRRDGNDKPTIVVTNPGLNMSHNKIISEVLRQYPNIVKGCKNIKLKILPPTATNLETKILIKREQSDAASSHFSGQQQQSVQVQKTQVQQTQTVAKVIEKVSPHPACKVLVQKAVNPASATSTPTPAPNVASVAPAADGKRRIDSKTMHALIALGAENTTGPWLCLRCGINGRPISIPSYRGFRRHLINTHKESIDSALCEHCGWRSTNNRQLHYHIQTEHKVKSTLYTFPGCLMCSQIFLDTNTLNQHMLDSHPDENKQQCIYCNKIFAKELQLYAHMKTYHKKQALEDGIMDYSDEEYLSPRHGTESERSGSSLVAKKDSKIKILSDISLPTSGNLIKLEPSSEAAALNTVATGIATSIGITNADDFETNTATTSETKFVNADGNEMMLTEEQRKEIISQLDQESDSRVVMMLNESSKYNLKAQATSNESEQDDEEVPAEEVANATDEDYDDSQIYNEFSSQNSSHDVEEDETKKASLDESKDSLENLEWAENLISAHEMADEAARKATQVKDKKDDDISKKLKELTGDWSEDENDDDDVDDEEGDDEDFEATAQTITAGTPTEQDSEYLEEDEVKQQASAEATSKEENEGEEDEDEHSTTETAKSEKDIENENEDDAPASVEQSQPPNNKLDSEKAEEDELELAMKSMHREDTAESNKIHTEEEAKPDDTQPEENKEVIEKESEEKVIKVEQLSPPSKDVSISEVVNASREIPIESNVRKALIDELSDDTDSIKEEDEFTELDEEEKAKLKMAETLGLKHVEEAETLKKDGVEDSIQDEEIDAAIEMESELSAPEEDAITKVDDKDDPVSTTTSTTTKTAGNTTANKTEEKVKSLISEWGDEDEEEEFGEEAEHEVEEVGEEDEL